MTCKSLKMIVIPSQTLARPALRALAPERTWYVGSLSKTISAGLRFGYVLCPEGMGEAGRLTAQHGFFALARPVSDLCLRLFNTGAADRIAQAVQAEFAARLDSHRGPSLGV